MNEMRKQELLGVFCTAMLYACAGVGKAQDERAGGDAPAAHRTASLEQHQRIVRPFVDKHCVECHGGFRHEGDFSINGSFSFSFSRLNNVDTAQFSIGVNGLTASVTDSN